MTKRKCEVDFVYLSEGCGMTRSDNKRYNAPHLYTATDWYRTYQLHIYKK